MKLERSLNLIGPELSWYLHDICTRIIVRLYQYFKGRGGRDKFSDVEQRELGTNEGNGTESITNGNGSTPKETLIFQSFTYGPV